jgi:glycosyltransferase involved in cell wall biosynthesis
MELFAPSDFDDSGIPQTIRRTPLPIRAHTAPLADWSCAGMLVKEVRRNFDIVHAHGLRAALIGVTAARRARLPALFTAHNLVPSGGLLSRLALLLIQSRAERVIAVSHAVALGFGAQADGAGKIVEIPNGIDCARFAVPIDRNSAREECGLPAGAPLIAGIGRLAQEKGFDTLIHAFRDVLRHVPEANLAIAGDGPERSRLVDRIGSLFSGPEAQRIHLLGHLADVRPLLGAADLLAVPSRSEGQGIAALEAMAAGLPVVAFAVGGLPEVVVEGVTGRLVEAEDAAALCRALCELLGDAGLRAAYGDAGRARVLDEFTVERMAERTLDLYRQCLGI